jgi:hypothetical protein
VANRSLFEQSSPSFERCFLQVSSAAPMSGRASVHEDWALVAVAAGGGWGEDWSGSSWLIPIASVVPVSL